MARKTWGNLIKTILAGLLSLLILSLFLMGYNYTGVHIQNPSGATDYKWTSNQLKTNMKEGFAWFRMDQNGFNNDLKATNSDQIDILLMGSSHLEAIGINKHENLGYILNQLLPDKTTYNIGISGHDIFRCVKNIKNAIAEYQPADYVIIETDTAALSSEKVQEVLNGEMLPIPSYDNSIMFLLQKYCPAIKAIYKQADIWMDMDSSTEDESIGEYATPLQLDLFAKKMKNDCGDHVTPIVCYQPSYGIDSVGKLVFDENQDEVKAFTEACLSNGIIFVNMTEAFEKMYENNYILAHGFMNSAVSAGHLNKYGHTAIAEALAAIIKEEAH